MFCTNGFPPVPPRRHNVKKTTEDARPAIDTMVARIEANPKYHALKRKRNGFGWMLTVLMLVVYYGYILLIAFDKELLATRIGNGVTTWGIPIGFGVIIFTIVITADYVRRANREFDYLTEKVRAEALK